MQLYPKYAENIIVGIKRKKGFEWYITECDEWILDINKYANAFEENGFAFDKEFALSIRGNIDIINEETIDSFLMPYKENVVSTEELRDMIRKKAYEGTILALKPSLYIDFEERELLSLFPEALAFEKYVPEHWSGKYEDFTENIPAEERYWIIDGENMIDEEFEIEKKSFKEA